jgi:hypothetical protein
LRLAKLSFDSSIRLMGKKLLALLSVLSVAWMTGCRTPAKDQGLVFCQRCGVIAGKPTPCPNADSHDFVQAPVNAKVVCKQCGATPSTQPTKCPGHTSHQFAIFNH